MIKYILPLLFLASIANNLYAVADVIEFDKEGTIHIPIWVTKNGCIYPKAFEGAIKGELTINVSNDGKPFITNEGKPLVWNEGKPFILATNEGKPVFLLTNEGGPLITNNGPLIADNQGKPYILATNNGPLIAFDNRGQPLAVIHFDTGALQKTADNAIYIVVTILGVIMLAISGVLVWYIIRKEREISDHKVYAQKMESECRTLKQKIISDDAVKA